MRLEREKSETEAAEATGPINGGPRIVEVQEDGVGDPARIAGAPPPPAIFVNSDSDTRHPAAIDSNSRDTHSKRRH